MRRLIQTGINGHESPVVIPQMDRSGWPGALISFNNCAIQPVPLRSCWLPAMLTDMHARHVNFMTGPQSRRRVGHARPNPGFRRWAMLATGQWHLSYVSAGSFKARSGQSRLKRNRFLRGSPPARRPGEWSGSSPKRADGLAARISRRVHPVRYVRRMRSFSTKMRGMADVCLPGNDHIWPRFIALRYMSGPQ